MLASSPLGSMDYSGDLTHKLSRRLGAPKQCAEAGKVSHDLACAIKAQNEELQMKGEELEARIALNS